MRVTPPQWYDLDEQGCAKTGGAFSDVDINWITICPETFIKYPPFSMVTPDEDISASDPDTYIQKILPLGGVLMHEFLHILYNDASK